jgi:Zn-dependent peptidase ImmA (M78 family)
LKFPFLPEKSIRRAARETTEAAFGAGLAKYPLDLEALVYDHFCDRYGLIFDDSGDLEPVNGEEVLGRTDLVAGRIHIQRNLRHENAGRFRFTIAHELGHWVLHRPIVLASLTARNYQRDLGLPGLFTTLVRTIQLEDTGASEEWQANIFASHLLIPREALAREYHDRFGPHPISLEESPSANENLRQLARSTARHSGHKSCLAEAFGVSVEAAAIALERSGLVVATPTLL